MICFLALVLACAPQASAALYTLTDQNSSVTVDTASQAGAYNWAVDGQDILYQQWFWYRIGNTAEHPIDTVDSTPAVTATPRSLFVTYSAANFSIEVDYLLTGGSAGSRTSDVAETIRITNTGTSALDFHFFQYSDFDLSGNDTVQIQAGAQDVHQTPASPAALMMNETVVAPAPNHWEANTYHNTLDSLNNGTPTTLNNNFTAGPGDVTWAFEWDTNIAAGNTFIISKDKRTAPNVPEPAAIGLLGGVLLLVARKLRAHVA
jgi:hypothetical protein